MKEKILCAAIWYPEFPTAKDNIPSSLLRPVNCIRGIVFCGHRHPHCLYQAVAITGKSDHELGGGVQGFLTSFNRFVDRREGAIIHRENGHELNYGKSLFSEDLY